MLNIGGFNFYITTINFKVQRCLVLLSLFFSQLFNNTFETVG